MAGESRRGTRGCIGGGFKGHSYPPEAIQGAMMRKVVLSFGLMLAVAGCQVQNEEDIIEGSIQNTLANQGNVQEVQITQRDENNFNGFAVVRDNTGHDNRLNCTARRTAEKQSNFDWRCLPTIDELALTNVETAIRQDLSQRMNVVEVDMSRRDDSNMAGFVRVRDANGSEVRTDCSAVRENEMSQRFNWRCGPDAAPAAAAGDDGKDGK